MNRTAEIFVNADATPQPRCIGIFDSGIGGLSILRALRARLPEASMVYVGDVAWAPYGERTADEVVERSLRVADWLAQQGATMIVVACNTATVLAIETLRARRPEFTFVGVEPGIKPAVARSRTGRVAVMATPATAASARLRHLIERHAEAAHVHVQACAGLVAAIERGQFEGPVLTALLQPHCDAIRAAKVDTVVLGCTHYPFVTSAIGALLGDAVSLVDTAVAVAERAASLWHSAPLARQGVPLLRIGSTGATGTLQSLLSVCAGLEHIDVEVLTIIASTPPG